MLQGTVAPAKYNPRPHVIGQQGTTLPPYPEKDYTLHKATVPGILILIVSGLEFFFFIIIGILRGGWHSTLMTAFLFFLVTGALAVICTRPERSSSGYVIALLIWGVISSCHSLAQTVMMFLDLIHRGLMLYGQARDITLMFDSMIIILALVALCCCIALIVQSSEVVCCRKSPQPRVQPQIIIVK